MPFLDVIPSLTVAGSSPQGVRLPDRMDAGRSNEQAMERQGAGSRLSDVRLSRENRVGCGFGAAGEAEGP